MHNAAVVFQGAGSSQSWDALSRSIARLNAADPTIEVIISTWKSTPVPDIGQNRTVYTDDLQSFSPEGYKPCNLHRQLATSLNGIRATKAPLCAKLRLDIEIVDAEVFIACLRRDRRRGAKFNRVVTAIEYSSVDPLRNKFPLLYHVCDWVYIGETKDLLSIFSAPLPSKSFFTHYVERAVNPRLAGYAEALRAETYLTSFAIRKCYWHSGHTEELISPFAAIRSNINIARNFEIEKMRALGITSLKHNVEGFDPNRYTKFANSLWRMPRDKSERRRRKLALRLYYWQQPLFAILREAINIYKSIRSNAFNN